MKKKKNNWKILVFIIISIILFFCSLILDRKVGLIENYLKDIAIMIEKIVIYPFTAYSEDKEEVKSESYLIQKNINSSLEKEIEELKKALELNKTLTEFTPVNATILSRNKSYWFNTITIDKGKKSGIKRNMAVITKDGLIGKITKTSDFSSEVKLITSDDTNFKVSVAIRTNNIDNYAILNGYDSKNNLIKATGIDKTTEVNKGDIVLTSGLGEMFPQGIYIGTVEEIKKDKYNLSKTIYIKTYQDFNNIHYVTVLKVKE